MWAHPEDEYRRVMYGSCKGHVRVRASPCTSNRAPCMFMPCAVCASTSLQHAALRTRIISCAAPPYFTFLRINHSSTCCCNHKTPRNRSTRERGIAKGPPHLWAQTHAHLAPIHRRSHCFGGCHSQLGHHLGSLGRVGGAPRVTAMSPAVV
jgi:hypothetical protein